MFQTLPLLTQHLSLCSVAPRFELTLQMRYHMFQLRAAPYNGLILFLHLYHTEESPVCSGDSLQMVYPDQNYISYTTPEE